MSDIFIPVSFLDRRGPTVEKVIRDGNKMYEHALYIIVLNAQGEVVEARFNQRFDNDVVDCLVILTSCMYQGRFCERVVALEIGFRRFVPYAQCEYRLNGPTKRGPSVKRPQKNEVTPFKVFTIKSRTTVIRLTEDIIFDILPVITTGIQQCVDRIIGTWTNSEVLQHRGFWNHYEHEASIFVRFPSDENLLCSTASFAEEAWRIKPEKQLHSIAKSIKKLLNDFMILHHKDDCGEYSLDDVRRSKNTYYVYDKISKRMKDKGYSQFMIESLLNLVGESGSPERKIVGQIWEIYKLPKIQISDSLNGLVSEYEEMKNILLERWLIQNYRSLRHEDNKRKLSKQRMQEKKSYNGHARNCLAFSVFASKEALTKIMTEYDVSKVARAKKEEITVLESSVPSDDDIPF